VTYEEWQILGLTLRTAALSTLLIVPPGLAIAWLLARHRWRGKSLVETLVALPLVMPPVATGLILLKLLGRRGPVGGWLHRTFDMDIVFTWRAVVLAMMVMSFPLLVRALSSIETSSVKCASGSTTSRRVTLTRASAGRPR